MKLRRQHKRLGSVLLEAQDTTDSEVSSANTTADVRFRLFCIEQAAGDGTETNGH
jgi:hypothetical protein